MDPRTRDNLFKSIARTTWSCIGLLSVAACTAETTAPLSQMTPMTTPSAAMQPQMPAGVIPMMATTNMGVAGAPVPAAPVVPQMPIPAATAGAPAPAMPVAGGAAAPAPAAPGGPVARCKYTRKSAKSLTPAEREAFVKAILKLKEMPSPFDAKYNYYDQFVYWHIALQFCDPKSTQPMMHGHGAPMFLPWHREHLILFDEALAKVSEIPIATPFWDWTDSDISYVFADDFMGGTGERAMNNAVMTGPFRKDAFIIKIDPPGLVGSGAMALQRSLGNPMSLPKPSEAMAALMMPKYDVEPWDLRADITQSFRNRVEGNTGMGSIFTGGTGLECPESGVMPLPIGGVTLHNRVHSWVGGQMGTAASPNDPVFWLHHCNTDRLWWQWQKMHGIDTYEPKDELPKNSLNDVMMPFDASGIHSTAAMVADSEKLGVCYEGVDM